VSEEPKGLHGKYVVFKSKDVNVDKRGDRDFYEVLYGCQALDGCFVLRPEKDKAARRALVAYAAYAGEVRGERELAVDLRAWVRKLGMERPL